MSETNYKLPQEMIEAGRLSRLELVSGPPPGYRVRISWEGSHKKAQLILKYIQSIDPVIDGTRKDWTTPTDK